MIARFIISAATTAVTMAVANYAGKAVGEKIRKDHGPQIDAFKQRQAALKLMKHLVRGNTMDVKSELSEKLWAQHGMLNQNKTNSASALFVLKDRPAAVIVNAIDNAKSDNGNITITLIEGKNTITRTVSATSTQAAVKAVIGDNYFIEGYNLDEVEVVKGEVVEVALLENLFEGTTFK